MKNLAIPHSGSVNIFCKCSWINELFITNSAALVIFPGTTHRIKNDTVQVLKLFTIISTYQLGKLICLFLKTHKTLTNFAGGKKRISIVDKSAFERQCLNVQKRKYLNGNVIQSLAPHLMHPQTVSIFHISQTPPELCHSAWKPKCPCWQQYQSCW